jgi:hypothetical protein
MSFTATETRLIENANRLGKDALHASVALELVTGRAWRALCCWCLDKVDPQGEREAVRLHVGGDCPCCPYSGRDTLLVAPAA